MPLAEQRRELWDATAIAEGQALLTRTPGRGPVGQYQIQAAITALHDEATTAADTDWQQSSPSTTSSPRSHRTRRRTQPRGRGSHGARPVAGLAALGALDADDRATHTHRVGAVRAHLLEQAGDPDTARECYLRAARMTASLPEQRYLTRRAAQLGQPTP